MSNSIKSIKEDENKKKKRNGNNRKFFNKTQACEYLGITDKKFDQWKELGLIQTGRASSPTGRTKVWTKEMLDKVAHNIEKGLIAN